ncbi:hypothetical protein BGW80DRAFT_1250480 [Lactifluus volemus]|nr:hypothetical protein BGW80DRAFT_1250480 [Lactifluus volemus]
MNLMTMVPATTPVLMQPSETSKMTQHNAPRHLALKKKWFQYSPSGIRAGVMAGAVVITVKGPCGPAPAPAKCAYCHKVQDKCEASQDMDGSDDLGRDKVAVTTSVLFCSSALHLGVRSTPLHLPPLPQYMHPLPQRLPASPSPAAPRHVRCSLTTAINDNALNKEIMIHDDASKPRGEEFDDAKEPIWRPRSPSGWCYLKRGKSKGVHKVHRPSVGAYVTINLEAQSCISCTDMS